MPIPGPAGVHRVPDREHRNAETREFLERTGAVNLGKPFLVAKVMQAIQRALDGRPPADVLKCLDECGFGPPLDGR